MEVLLFLSLFDCNLLDQSIDRSIDQFKMLITDKMIQYFYAREGEIWLMADSHAPSCRSTDSFLQGLGFVELIDRVLKIEM